MPTIYLNILGGLLACAMIALLLTGWFLPVVVHRRPHRAHKWKALGLSVLCLSAFFGIVLWALAMLIQTAEAIGMLGAGHVPSPSELLLASTLLGTLTTATVHELSREQQ